ncbi:MAG TPA: hypothetical protein VFW94_13965 [Candidatus Acidoferrales bacterium]|nr:hypothetical protein [Candidatus Acidoferrales bacterium]
MANLSAGRVIVAVVKDAILVGTVENPIEAQTRPPTPVQMSSERMGVTLGAMDWFSPSTHRMLAEIDLELPHLHSSLVQSGPHLGETEAGNQATDIQAIGQGVLERLNQVASGLHENVHLAEGQPLAELIVADYMTGYGPEVWQVNFGLDQQPEQGEFWDTRVTTPQYLQFYPPEKGQPHTLVEFDYPPQNAPPTLLDLLRRQDPRLQKVIASDPAMGEVAGLLLKGDSKKIKSQDSEQFLRAALAAITPPGARETFAVIGQESGFRWVLRPPPEPTMPGEQRPAGAPSLVHPSGAPSLVKKSGSGWEPRARNVRLRCAIIYSFSFSARSCCRRAFFSWTDFTRLSLWATILRSISGSESARIWAAKIAAFAAPALSMATVATGIPLGICTVARRASSPFRVLVAIGTPMTGSVVLAATTPAK